MCKETKTIELYILNWQTVWPMNYILIKWLLKSCAFLSIEESIKMTVEENKSNKIKTANSIFFSFWP